MSDTELLPKSKPEPVRKPLRSEAPVAPNQGGGTATIEIVIGAATVRVAPGIDAATLTAVLRAVKAAT